MPQGFDQEGVEAALHNVFFDFARRVRGEDQADEGGYQIVSYNVGAAVPLDADIIGYDS